MLGVTFDTIVSLGKGALDITYTDTLFGTEFDTSSNFRAMNTGMISGKYGMIIGGWARASAHLAGSDRVYYRGP